MFDIDHADNDQLFLVMEYVHGVNVADVLGLSSLTYPVIRRVVLEVLEALACIHGQRIVHRDISPSNLLISRQGEVKVSDFGLATIGEGGVFEHGFKGKTAYASPEAIQCVEVGASADLYSLAAIMYQMFVGVPPFGWGSIVQINKRMMDWTIPSLPDDVPDDLRTMVTSLLHHAPEQRGFQSADELIHYIDERGFPVADTVTLARLAGQAGDLRVLEECPPKTDTLVVPSGLTPITSDGGATSLVTTSRVGGDSKPHAGSGVLYRIARRGTGWVLAASVGALIGLQFRSVDESHTVSRSLQDKPCTAGDSPSMFSFLFPFSSGVPSGGPDAREMVGTRESDGPAPSTSDIAQAEPRKRIHKKKSNRLRKKRRTAPVSAKDAEVPVPKPIPKHSIPIGFSPSRRVAPANGVSDGGVQ